MKKNLLLVFACLFAGISFAAENALSTRTWTNVAYGTTSATQKLDIFLPSTGEGPFPVVIWIHGGAFMMGTKDNPQSKTALNNAGFAVVSINYRLSSEAKWPAQLDDLKACVKFLRTNAATYALDPNKFASFGASAGGHLASMMGAALASDPATRIQATVEWFGPLHFYYMDEDMLASDFILGGGTRATGANGESNSPESALLGVTVKNNLAACYAASPISYVDTMNVNTPFPQFLCMHGNKDPNIAPKQSVRLHNAIQSRFGTSKSQYVLLPAGTHGGGDFTLASTETTVVNFLTSQLKSTSAISNVSQQSDVQVYPTHVTDGFCIKTSEENAVYEIFDLSGSAILKGAVSGQNISCKGLKGVYLVRVKKGNSTLSIKKIVVA